MALGACCHLFGVRRHRNLAKPTTDERRIVRRGTSCPDSWASQPGCRADPSNRRRCDHRSGAAVSVRLLTGPRPRHDVGPHGAAHRTSRRLEILQVSVEATLVICAGCFLGGDFGATLADGIPAHALERTFGVAMLAIATTMLFATWPRAMPHVQTTAPRCSIGESHAHGTAGFVRSLFTQLFRALTSMPAAGGGLSRSTYWNVPNG